MTSCNPHRCCEAVRSAILATAWLLVDYWHTRQKTKLFTAAAVEGVRVIYRLARSKAGRALHSEGSERTIEDQIQA